MLVVTLRSVIEELKPLGQGQTEIILVDNSDTSLYKLLQDAIPGGYIQDGTIKVFRQEFPCIFTARDLAVEKASGKYIACVDGHMLIGNDMFVDLFNFMESKDDDPTLGFAHAPINWLHQHESRARHDRDMSTCELGDWGLAYETPRTITWKGMPWICRKTLWEEIGGYGALSQHKISWGGGDMHIGIKPWMLGFKNWAVPTSPGIHIGPFPNEETRPKAPITARDRYRVYSTSGTTPHSFGFLVSCYVLGGEEMIDRNREAITRRFSSDLFLPEWIAKAIEYGKDEKAWLDDRKITSFENLLGENPWDYASQSL